MNDDILRGIPITAPTTDLRRIAIAAHQAWFAAPANGAAMHTYARALRAWARAMGNANALAHAARLAACVSTADAAALPDVVFHAVPFGA